MYIKHIFDKTQTIPDHSKTRKEMLMEKAGEGGGGDITIKQLTATENRTYSEEGTAYSPVIVNVPDVPPVLDELTVTENGKYTPPSGTDGYDEVTVSVPLPSNAYLLKEIEDVAIASFNDGADLPMPKLEVAIEPQQEGSGDPSSTNIRPISGWDECKVTVADDLENPTVENVYTIDLDGTRYGGTLDVVSGVLVVDKAIVDLGDLSWSNSSNGWSITNGISSSAKSFDNNTIASAKCSIYKADTASNVYRRITNNTIGINNASSVQIYDIRFIDKTGTEIADILDGVQLVYELATPQTIQLTPTMVKSLLGANNVWTDTGNILEASYFAKEASA